MDSTSATLTEDRITSLSLNIALRLTLVAVLVVWCFTIIRPFLIPVLWAIILAVALKGLFERLVRWVGGKRGLAATIFALVGIGLIVWPSYRIGESLLTSAAEIESQVASGTLQIPSPPERIQNIPGVGEQIFDVWTLANTNVQQAAVQVEPQIRTFVTWLLGFMAGLGGMVITTVLALIIAAVMLTYSESGTKMLRSVTGRMQGSWDEDLVGIAGSTISSVAKGVLGVAVVQSGLCAIGLFVAGVPAAGLLTIGVLILAIIQLPPILIMIPAIIWAWGNLTATWALLLTIYLVLAGASDTPLKAVFLSRGAVVPMPVVLLGAIGGMVSMGMMGLFIGAVVLSVGYKIFQLWLTGVARTETVSSEA